MEARLTVSSVAGSASTSLASLKIRINGVDPRLFAGEDAQNRWNGGHSFPSKVAYHPTFPRDQKVRSETQNCASDGENGAESSLLHSNSDHLDQLSAEKELANRNDSKNNGFFLAHSLQ